MPYHRIAAVTDEQLRVCESEPIHIPESIQPHGALVVVDAGQWRIERISRNAEEFFGVSPERLCGAKLSELVGNGETWEHARAELQQELRSPCELRRQIALKGRLEDLICECHAIDETTLALEFERPSPLPGESSGFETLNVIRETARILDRGDGIKAVLTAISQSIRRYTGYDRVMIYQMDREGHGQVVAEAKREDLTAYLGLHFPASDIPKQARKLYVRNRVRLLADICYQPVPIIGCDGDRSGEPIDMSLCQLRSVSPVHLEYLQNMGVRATLVISIMIDNRLWGLIACHHDTPRHVDATVRNRCEQLAHFITAIVEAEEQRQQRLAIESSHDLQQSLAELIGTNVDWQRRFLRAGNHLLDQMNASGLAFYDGGEFFTVGEVPFSGMLEKVRRVLQRRSDGEFAMTDALKYEDEAFASIGADYAGCLLGEISQNPATQLLWFRKEKRHHVDWGGDPRKSLLPTDAANTRLSPRKSFEKWTQLVEGQCQPWTKQDLHRAKAIGQFIAARKVEDASRRQNQFLTNLSHEIRTPMTAILGFVDILARDIAEVKAGEQAAAMASIRQHGERLLNIIEQMISLCQAEAGTLPIKRETISLTSWVRELAQSHGEAVARSGLHFGCHVPEPVPCEIVSDRQLIDQIITALVDNATRFTDEGRVDITFQMHPKSAEQLEILVKDSGPGLAPENAKRIFQSFYQVDGTLTRRRGGVGLGLTVARQFAESLGGSLELKDSTPGLGTTFSLSLPVGSRQPVERIRIAASDIQPAVGNTRDIESPTPLLGLHILLVEDSVDNQRLIAFHLRRSGAQVAFAENGQVAIDTLREMNRSKTRPDIILMDMQMPVMDGYRATETLRHMGCTIPIIALTAHAMTGQREKCLHSGCDEYITKPIQPQTLTKTILALTEASRVVKVGDLFP